MKNKLMKRFSSDEANSATVEFILLLLLLVMVLFTILDFGMYFNNRAIVSNASQNGARLAAIFGGATETSISRQYGSKSGGNRTLNMTPKCTGVANNAIACIVLEDLLNTKGAVQLKINKVDCGPGSTTGIGTRTWCEVKWEYTGIPGSALSALPNGYGEQTTRMTSESEVVIK